MDNIGDIRDVVQVLKRIANEIHPKMMEVYSGDPNKAYVLSAGGTLLIGFAAGCGYMRNRVNLKARDAALDKLVAMLNDGSAGPLNLDEYWRKLSGITSS